MTLNDEFMNRQEENEQEHIVPRRITRNMTRQVIFAHKNIPPLSVSPLCVSWTC